jgi:hypothetical protein
MPTQRKETILILGLLATMVVVFVPVANAQYTHFYENLNPRSYALGSSGVADAKDPANAALNSAAVGYARGIYGSFLFSAWTFGPDDVTSSGVSVGAGGRTLLGQFNSVGGGLAFTHARHDFDSNVSNDRTHGR